jgi:putative ABC transport system permease protein
VTYKIVRENMLFKPMRSLLSVLLIGVPVTLILCLVGVSQGLLEDSARRTRGIGADVMVRPPGSSILSLSGAPMSWKYVDTLAKVEHVTVATGVIMQPLENSLTAVAGIDAASFFAMNGGFRFIEGGMFRNPDDILIDTYYARQKNAHAGSKIKVLNRQWNVAGIFEAGMLSHIVLPLKVEQELTSNTGKISQVFLKVDAHQNIPVVVAKLKATPGLEDHPIYPVEEFTSQLAPENVGGVREFINVVIGIGLVIGFGVVCLSMYMAVLQRTREIGILKSLGASRWFILRLILAEAGIMAIGGTILGILFSFGARWVILQLVPASIPQVIVYQWWPRTAIITLIGALLGALYPGLSAARKDPIEALAYE